MRYLSSPEIWRYARSEAKPQRLIAGFITMNLLGFAIYLMASQTKTVGTNLYNWIFGTQWVLLLMFGAMCAGGSVAFERSERTWDFQRLSPLTSLELTWGKLIGAPIFAYFLFACLVPWMLLGVVLSDEKNVLDLCDGYTRIFSVVFFVLSASLMLSAYNEGTRSGSAVTYGVLAGLVALLTTSRWIFDVRVRDAWDYYGLPLPIVLFVSASAGVFGLWAFMGARWRIGEDFLEETRFWRLPAFMGFLHFYVLGFIHGKPLSEAATWSLIAFPAWMVYVASLANPFGLDRLRRWQLSVNGFERLNRSPVWVGGAAALVPLSLVTAGLNSFKDPTLWRILVLVPAFALRDMAFLQWCRLGQSRRPEVMAVVYLLLAYLVPPLIMISFKAERGFGFFVPFISPDETSLANLLPSMAQAILMFGLIWIRTRTCLKQERIPT